METPIKESSNVTVKQREHVDETYMRKLERSNGVQAEWKEWETKGKKERAKKKRKREKERKTRSFAIAVKITQF